MLHKIDDFILKRVFQPVCDALARWVSCYEIAEFLLMGFVLGHSVSQFAKHT